MKPAAVLTVGVLLAAMPMASHAQAIDFSRVTCAEFKTQMTQHLQKEFGLNVWFWAVGYWAAKNGKPSFDPKSFGHVTRETTKACDAAPQQLFVDALLSVRPQ